MTKAFKPIIISCGLERFFLVRSCRYSAGFWTTRFWCCYRQSLSQGDFWTREWRVVWVAQTHFECEGGYRERCTYQWLCVQCVGYMERPEWVFANKKGFLWRTKVKWPPIVGHPITGGYFMSKYSRELKHTIAKEYLENGLSSHQLGARYSIEPRQIRYWGQVYVIHGSHSEPSPHPRTAEFKF